MTSALHAEGREFNPRLEYFLLTTNGKKIDNAGIWTLAGNAH